MIIFVFFLILLFIFFIILYDTTLIENYTNREKVIILMGDSIFDNQLYVDKCVVDYIQEKSKDQIICLAKDNSTIQDTIQEQFPLLNRQNNNSNTYIFVSVGGNDILQKIVFSFQDSLDTQQLDHIISHYENLVDELIIKMNESHIILLTLYYPHASYYRQFYSEIDKWNLHVKKIAKKYHCRVLDLSTFMNESEDFSHSIEPSDIGGEKIVDKILRMC